MPQLFIPACGDRITLTKAWTFDLVLESRNITFAEQRKELPEPAMTSYRGEADYQSWPDRRYQTHPITLPKGTVLEVDRVYIRNFNRAALEEQDNFDSITFKVVGAKKQRFWVKLKDANHIQFKLDTTYAVREKIAKQLVHG